MKKLFLLGCIIFACLITMAQSKTFVVCNPIGKELVAEEKNTIREAIITHIINIGYFVPEQQMLIRERDVLQNVLNVQKEASNLNEIEELYKKKQMLENIQQQIVKQKPEQTFIVSSAVDMKNICGLGKKFQGDFVLVTDVSTFFDKVRILCKIIDVKSAAVILEESQNIEDSKKISSYTQQIIENLFVNFSQRHQFATLEPNKEQSSQKGWVPPILPSKREKEPVSKEDDDEKRLAEQNAKLDAQKAKEEKRFWVPPILPSKREKEPVSKEDDDEKRLAEQNAKLDAQKAKEEKRFAEQNTKGKKTPFAPKEEILSKENESVIKIEAIGYVVPIKDLVIHFNKMRATLAGKVKKWEQTLYPYIEKMNENQAIFLQTEKEWNEKLRTTLKTSDEMKNLQTKLKSQRKIYEQSVKNLQTVGSSVIKQLNELLTTNLKSTESQFKETMQKITLDAPQTTISAKAVVPFSNRIENLQTLPYLKPTDELVNWIQDIEHSFYQIIESNNQKVKSIVEKDKDLEQQLSSKNKQLSEFQKDSKKNKNEIVALKKEIGKIVASRKELSSQTGKNSKVLMGLMKNYNKKIQKNYNEKMKNAIQEIDASFKKN